MKKIIKVTLDPGHGEGKMYNRGSLIGNEGDNNFKMSKLLKTELEKLGVEVSTTRDYINMNPSLDFRGRCGKGSDLLLSLHTNAANSKASGVEVFDDVNPRNKNTKLGEQLCKTTASVLDIPNRGVKYRSNSKGYNYYGLLRFGQATNNMIIEFCFHDNKNDITKYLDRMQKLASEIAKTIYNHYSEKFPEGEFPKSILDSGTVNVDTLNVRSDAGILNKIVGKIHKGDKVKIYDEKKSWLNIGPGRWVHSKYIDLNSKNAKSKYYELGGLKIIETTSDNIYIQAIGGKNLHSTYAYGMSGTFQDTANSSKPESIWSIAVNNGKPLGPNAFINSPKGERRGTIICYEDNSVEVKRVNAISQISGKIKWAIGGGMFIPDYNPALEGFVAPFDDVLRNTYHTAIAHKGKTIFLILSRPCTMAEFRAMVSEGMDVDGAIFLDGGGSAQMFYKGNKGLRQPRKLSHMIGIRSV